MNKQLNKKSKWQWHGFDIWDIVLLGSSFLMFTAFFIVSMCQKEVPVPTFFRETEQKLPGWAVWTTYVSYFANLINAINLILTIKKRISNCYFGIACSILIGFVTLAQGLIWQTVRYWGVAVVGQIITLISWIKASKDKKAVETFGGNWLFFAITAICMCVLAGLLAWFETTQWFANVFFKDKKPLVWYLALFDALPLAALIASVALIIKRQNQYWIICYILVGSSLILWILKLCPIQGQSEISIKDFSCWQMLCGTILNFGFAVKGHLNWRSKKQ